ncbi:hypothetical protein [Actinomadura sp. 21ATH]|uniref:hypothetical protein n=1 Tax=Actinomadura sp. 21ATH TaxID=1735444 RepID=UPI0035BFE47A
MAGTAGRATAFDPEPMLRAFRRHLAAEDKSPKTIKVYTGAARKFGQWLPADVAEWYDIEPGDVQDFISEVSEIAFVARDWVAKLGLCSCPAGRTSRNSPVLRIRPAAAISCAFGLAAPTVRLVDYHQDHRCGENGR